MEELTVYYTAEIQKLQTNVHKLRAANHQQAANKPDVRDCLALLIIIDDVNFWGSLHENLVGFT